MNELGKIDIELELTKKDVVIVQVVDYVVAGWSDDAVL